MPPKGLATLALLKTRYDTGQDHLGLFEPFVEDILPLFEGAGFTVAQCKDLVAKEHGLVVPQDALGTVLNRLTRRNLIRRDAGLYWPGDGVKREATIQEQKTAAENEFRELAEVFVSFAAPHGVALRTDQALQTLITFLFANDVVLILDELADLSGMAHGMLSRHHARLTARFVREIVLRDARLSQSLERLVRGIVLQNALLLRDISQPNQKFAALDIFFDTGFLFALVGAKGATAEAAAKESASLLWDLGAKLKAFDSTIDEMRRILQVYERHLATPEGQLMLYPTELTFHFLAARATPADIRQLSSLLERKVEALGFTVVPSPKRNREFTYNEESLAKALAGPNETGHEHRIQHDVDSVAAILQFRKGTEPVAIERAIAVFATTTGVVVRTVNEWYRSEGGRGMSPIIHQLALSHIAWLKKPASAPTLQLHELAALCDAALRPTDEVWSAFKRTLDKLRSSGEVSTDEAVAVVADELTASLLSEVPDDVEPDAATIEDIINRVKAKYREQADKIVAVARMETAGILGEVTTRAALAEEAHRDLSERVEARAQALATNLAAIAYLAIQGLSCAALLIGLPGVFEAIPRSVRAAAWIVLFASVMCQIALGVLDHSALSLRHRLRDWLLPRTRRLVIGD